MKITAKIPMRIIAAVVIGLLTAATILYFYDTLAAAFGRLNIFHKKLSTYLASLMATIIGLGVLAESAPTIWDKFIYWGQYIDNKIIYYFKHKKYFLDTTEILLEQTRRLTNKTNLHLQSNHTQLKKINKYCLKIKSNCEKINTMLFRANAEDLINKKRIDRARNLLNTLVMENLQIRDRLEKLDKSNKKP